MRLPCRGAFRVRLMSKSGTLGVSSRGGWRAEKRKSYGIRDSRDRAGASRRANHGVFRHRALLSSGPSRIECADRSVSQLLAGTPSGPGGSSNAARVPRCDEARRRRTSSRFTTPHDRAPQWTRYAHDTRALQGGSCAGIISATHSSWPAMTNLVACERKASVIPLSGNTGDQRYSTAPSGAWRCSHPARSSAGVSSSLSG